LCAADAGNGAERDFRLAELGGVGSDDDVAHHRQFAAAAERVTADGGDRRLAAARHAVAADRGKVAGEHVDKSLGLHFLDVGAGGKRLFAAGDQDATDRIICLDAAAIGRILMTQNATTTRLIDIALLGVYRNRGIGTMLLRQVLQECERQGRALRLQVLQGNRAIRLYQRLGFVQASADPMYAQMEWTAPSRC